MKTLPAARRLATRLRPQARALGFAAAFFAPAISSAIPNLQPPEDQVYFGVTEFTSGSVIVGRLDCYTELCSSAALVFSDDSGAVVSGQVVDVSAAFAGEYFGWLPDSPPAPGRYHVSSMAGALNGQMQIQITEASSALPTVSVVLNNYSTLTGERVDCIELASTAVEQGFYEQALFQVAAAATVQGENVSQYIYDMRLVGDEENRFTGKTLTRTAEGEPTEVCFEVFARPIVGGDDISLNADCLSTDGLTFGVVEEISSGMPSALKLCTVPPDGYFDEWCAGFAEQFATQSCVGTHPEACFAARQDCPDGDHPTDEEVEEALNGTGGAGTGTGGELNVAAGGSPGDPSSPPGSSSGSNDGSSSDTGGCSVFPVNAGSDGRFWVFLGIGLLAAFRRRADSQAAT